MWVPSVFTVAPVTPGIADMPHCRAPCCSEPEAQLVLSIAQQFKPHVWLNVHSGMEALFTPYDHKATVPDGQAAQVALQMLQVINHDCCQGKCVVGSGGKSVGWVAVRWCHAEMHVCGGIGACAEMLQLPAWYTSAASVAGQDAMRGRPDMQHKHASGCGCTTYVHSQPRAPAALQAQPTWCLPCHHQVLAPRADIARPCSCSCPGTWPTAPPRTTCTTCSMCLWL
jgi:hypothetical protein